MDFRVSLVSTGSFSTKEGGCGFRICGGDGEIDKGRSIYFFSLKEEYSLTKYITQASLFIFSNKSNDSRRVRVSCISVIADQ